MYTLEELKEKIASTLDELTIIEILNVNSFELVEAFTQRIEDRMDQLVEEIFDDEEED